MIATDGAPTDDDGHLQINELYRTLKNERGADHPVPVTIIACTGKQHLWKKRTGKEILLFGIDDDESMAYLNEWDKKLPNLDVVDDYKSERKEILECQGKNFPFSFGDVSFSMQQSKADVFFSPSSISLKFSWVV